MTSDAEILAMVCRVVRDNVKNPPAVIDADTKFVDLEYSTQKQPVALFLLYDIIRSCRSLEWIYPDYFNFQTTYQSIQNVSDACKLVRDGFDRAGSYKLEKQKQKDQETALKIKLKEVPLIDCGELIYGEPTLEKVQKFFLEGEFDEEMYLVQAIKLHLLTLEHKAAIDKLNLSIEDMLNGRYNGKQEPEVTAIYESWNLKLGFHSFGS